MTLTLPSSAEWTERCLADGEFSLAARNWSGGIRLKIGGSILEMLLQDGRLATVDSAAKGILEVSGATKVWQEVLAAVPARLHNDVMANISHGLGLALQADPVVFAQYYAALARSLELLRPSSPKLGETMAHDKDLTATSIARSVAMCTFSWTVTITVSISRRRGGEYHF